MASVLKISQILHPTANVPSLTINSDSTVSFDAGILNVTGPINGVIGANTPYSGTFTTLNASGNFNFTGTGNRITGDFSNATIGNRVMFQTNTTNGATAVRAIPNGTGTLATFQVGNNTDTSNQSVMALGIGPTEAVINSFINGTGTYLPIALSTGGSERVRIDTSGNVGIGTTSPVLGKLNVTTGFSATDTTSRSLAFFSSSDTYTPGSSPSGLYFSYTGAAALSSRTSDISTVTFGSGTLGALSFQLGKMILDTSGNLGLGVTPSGRLSIKQGAAQLDITTGSNDVSFESIDRGATSNSIEMRYYARNSAHVWYVGQYSAAARLLNSGNFLIGTTTDRLRLTVSGTTVAGPVLGTASGCALFANSDPNYGIMFGVQGSGDAWMQVQRVDGTATAYNMLLQPSGGSLLIGTADANGFKVKVGFTGTNGVRLDTTNASADRAMQFVYNAATEVGRIAMTTTATSYVTTSDYRLKENVQPMQNALAKVAQLKPCTYTWKTNGSVGEGFIAHELKSVCPSAVNGEKDAVDEEGNPIYQGIDTSFLVATLTAAIQEMKQIIDQQDARIKSLEGKV